MGAERDRVDKVRVPRKRMQARAEVRVPQLGLCVKRGAVRARGHSSAPHPKTPKERDNARSEQPRPGLRRVPRRPRERMHVLVVPLEDKAAGMVGVVDPACVVVVLEREARDVAQGPDPDGLVVRARREERAARRELDDVDLVAVAFEPVHRRDAVHVEHWFFVGFLG